MARAESTLTCVDGELLRDRHHRRTSVGRQAGPFGDPGEVRHGRGDVLEVLSPECGRLGAGLEECGRGDRVGVGEGDVELLSISQEGSGHQPDVLRGVPPVEHDTGDDCPEHEDPGGEHDHRDLERAWRRHRGSDPQR